MQFRSLSYLAFLPLLCQLAACASAPTPVKSAEEHFKEGESAYASRNFEEAVGSYKKVKESFSSPDLSTRAELKIADAYFENKAYIEAAAAYDDFRKLHPGHERSPYALYRLGLANYRQVAGIDTDPTPVKNAVSYLQSFLNQYPDSVYAQDAAEKLADCRAKQLAYENYVGNFYLRTGKYPSAVKRLSEALTRFPDQPGLDETLFLLAKAYQKSGEREPMRKVLEKLAAQYPASPLNREAALLFDGFARYSSQGR